MKKNSNRKTIKLTVLLYVVVVTGVLVAVNACKKMNAPVNPPSGIARPGDDSSPDQLTKMLTVAHMQPLSGSTTTEVRFLESEKIYFINNNSPEFARLQKSALSANLVKITYHSSGLIMQAVQPSAQEVENFYSHVGSPERSTGISVRVNGNTVNREVDKPQEIGVPNNSSTLTNVIPDLATAQIIFDYFTQQSCNLPGPYGVDFCISFQYTEDGCYARAHKMRWILENIYHYRCLKVFSFANSGSDALGVVANKWGGCCINWWYHVAPLVTIKTPGGNKSYVMDPAMFNTPVLLSTWLNAQQDKRCSSNAHVSMYSIQPATAYWPSNYAGTLFGTDPVYTQTDTTLVHYSHLKSCP